MSPPELKPLLLVVPLIASLTGCYTGHVRSEAGPHSEPEHITVCGKTVSLEVAELWCVDGAMPNLGDIERLQNLRKLQISGESFHDLRRVAELNLEEIDISWTSVEDLQPLSRMPALKTVHAFHTEISDLSPLTETCQLEELTVGGAKVTDLAPLRACKNLQVLRIDPSRIEEARGRPGPTTLEPLRGLLKLKELELGEAQIEDLSPLLDLPELTYVWFTTGANVPAEQIGELRAKGVEVTFLLRAESSEPPRAAPAEKN